MKKVLIAEDDPIFLQLLTTSLKKYAEKFELVTAQNGKIAMDILNTTPISLLLTDIQMPEMDGLQLLAFMVEKYPLVPCFVMTAYDTPELGEKLPKDIRAYFRKPFPPGTLGPLMVKALEKEPPSDAIHGISVSSFMNMVEMEKKTCLLEVRLPNASKGVFYFEKGFLCSAAATGGLKGEAAALPFITKKKARFTFRPLPKNKITKQFQTTIKDLLGKALNGDKADPAPKPPPPRKELELAGKYTSPNGDFGGRMTVTNVSIPSARMLLSLEPTFSIGDSIRINFNLDDQPRSLVNKDAIVTTIDDLVVTVDFTSQEHYDRLGPYLHFNGFEEKNW
jgi:CheY-like chemotaxis protein